MSQRFQFSASSCVLVLVLGPVAASCEAESTNDYGKQDLHYPDAGLAMDAGEIMSCDAGAPDAGQSCQIVRPTCGAELVVDACSTAESACLGTITGQITVPSDVMGGGDRPAKGTVVLAVLESIPTGGGEPTCPGGPNEPPTSAFTAIHCADLTAGKLIDFAIHGLPLGKQWYVLAGLDVNGNGVDACDLIGLSSAKVGVSSPGGSVALEAPISLNLSASLFVPAMCGSCE